jgi:1,4-dihydroxy-2-naphthoate octaprenyltransferase
MAHGTNNLLNDYTDYVRGVDKDNYFRAQYGPQPLEHGLLTKRQLLTYAAVTSLIAVVAGVILIWYRGGWTLPSISAPCRCCWATAWRDTRRSASSPFNSYWSCI